MSRFGYILAAIDGIYIYKSYFSLFLDNNGKIRYGRHIPTANLYIIYTQGS